ncbi:capsule biosynthesis protein [Pseudovibrio exalbescens]|uniref:capsule biosynthesis protein n=1 Tax=Pseudovibrio exalbescens TaxID=197461 RepID=UPI0023650D74|nr:capsular biosynthesis protein [Pseudovibrio exalbescens]
MGTPSHNYWGRLRSWREYLERLVDLHQITDIVYYADRRPYHRIAQAIARERGINAYAYEFGYLRPDWITLEKWGMGAYSHFPDDPQKIRSLAANVQVEWPSDRYPHPFIQEATSEVVYNLIPVFFPYLYPFYERDRYYHPIKDYFSYIPRLARSTKSETMADQIVEELTASNRPYFVVPLQMQSDYQIRHHSPYVHLSEMIDEVMQSFKHYAHKDALLVFKIHPFDNNCENWPKVISGLASHYGCRERIRVLDGGNLHQLLAHSQGTVLVNSTTGLQALNLGIPVKTLGIAIYDIEGLTCQLPLDKFWNNATKPDPALNQDLRKLLAASIQVHGSFFTPAGREAAAEEFTDRLVNGTVNSHGAYEEIPPRLERARKIGVPIPDDSYWSDKC